MRRVRSGSLPLTLPLAAALLAAPLLGAQAPAAGEPPGAATPQALVERLNAATEAEDLGEIANCLAPDDRAELVLGMVAATGMMVAFMQMGSDLALGMAEGMAEGLAEGLGGEELSPEQKAEMEAEMEAGRQEAAAKAAALEKRYTAAIEKHGLGRLLSEEGPGIELGEDGEELKRLLAGVDQGALLEELMALLTELGDDGPIEIDSSEGDGPLDLPETVTDLTVEGDDRAIARAGDETLELVRIDGRWYVKAPRDEAPQPTDAEPQVQQED